MTAALIPFRSLVLVAASEGATMAAPGGATVPRVDGIGCAREWAVPAHRRRGAAGKNKTGYGKKSWTQPDSMRSQVLRLSTPNLITENEAHLRDELQLLAFVRDRQFELRSLMAHQHAAELVPINLSAIDDQPW